MIMCSHGIEGMHIAGTIFGFDCNDCLLDMVEIVEEAVETNILPQLIIAEEE